LFVSSNYDVVFTLCALYSSGYQLFSKEMLVQLRDIKANERLQEIGRRWIALSDDDKRQWNKRKDALWVQYSKDLAKFKRVSII
jgi:hypothetical protein